MSEEEYEDIQDFIVEALVERGVEDFASSPTLAALASLRTRLSQAEAVVEAARAYITDEDCVVPGLHEAMERALVAYNPPTPESGR